VTRYVVIGDIHGNDLALESALAESDRIGYDKLIFIGDLLTYGPSVNPIIEKISELSKMPNIVVLRGNHDWIYDDLLFNGCSAYKDSLAPWVQNSIEMSASKLDLGLWRKINFQDRHISDGIYFGHANPFGSQNWRYLNSDNDLTEASDALREYKLPLGVFGHTHRMMVFQRRLYPLPIGRVAQFNTDNSRIRPEPLILNCGSVGQPRDKSNREHILVIDSHYQSYTYWFKPIEYDIDAHIADIMKSNLSPEAKNRVCQFHLQ